MRAIRIIDKEGFPTLINVEDISTVTIEVNSKNEKTMTNAFFYCYSVYINLRGSETNYICIECINREDADAKFIDIQNFLCINKEVSIKEITEFKEEE